MFFFGNGACSELRKGSFSPVGPAGPAGTFPWALGPWLGGWQAQGFFFFFGVKSSILVVGFFLKKYKGEMVCLRFVRGLSFYFSGL